VEVAEVWQDVFFVIHRLRVLLETLHKPLGNRSGCTDVFCLGEESGCPDSVAFFEWFVWEISFWVGGWLGRRFVFLIGILYKGWEGSSPAGIYLFGVLPLCIPFCLRLAVGLTTDAAAGEASGHFDGSGMEVDLQVVLVQPGDPEYHALLAKVGDCKQDMFGMSIVGHDYVNDLVNTSGLIEGPVYVVNWDQLGQLAGRKFGLGEEILVNEVSSGSGIHHGFGR